jgi:hypothetical protein
LLLCCIPFRSQYDTTVLKFSREVTFSVVVYCQIDLP